MGVDGHSPVGSAGDEDLFVGVRINKRNKDLAVVSVASIGTDRNKVQNEIGGPGKMNAVFRLSATFPGELQLWLMRHGVTEKSAIGTVKEALWTIESAITT